MSVTFNTDVIKVNTPDGTMYVRVMENEAGIPVHVFVDIGKTGTNIRAWTDAISSLINILLAHDVPLSIILTKLAGISTDRTSHNEHGIVRSGPAGVFYALGVYLAHKYVALDDRPFLDQKWLR